MKHQVFFSFHYGEDIWRIAQVRNMGIVEGQQFFSDNGWEKVRLNNDEAIKAWIDREMKMRSCVVVLIGNKTSTRKWVQYEIERAWSLGKGIVGIYIHNLEDSRGEQTNKGKNPFSYFCIDRTFNFIAKRDAPIDDNEIPLDEVCIAYEPQWYTSKYVYEDIQENISRLIDEAIMIRNRYPK